MGRQMNRLINLIRPDLRDFTAYSSARDEANNGQIWLNANESPFPHSLNRYPHKQPVDLKKLLTEIYQVALDQVVIARGSDEIIDLLPRLFCRSEQDAIM